MCENIHNWRFYYFFSLEIFFWRKSKVMTYMALYIGTCKWENVPVKCEIITGMCMHIGNKLYNTKNNTKNNTNKNSTNKTKQ